MNDVPVQITLITPGNVPQSVYTLPLGFNATLLAASPAEGQDGKAAAGQAEAARRSALGRQT